MQPAAERLALAQLRRPLQAALARRRGGAQRHAGAHCGHQGRGQARRSHRHLTRLLQGAARRRAVYRCQRFPQKVSARGARRRADPRRLGQRARRGARDPAAAAHDRRLGVHHGGAEPGQDWPCRGHEPRLHPGAPRRGPEQDGQRLSQEARAARQGGREWHRAHRALHARRLVRPRREHRRAAVARHRHDGTRGAGQVCAASGRDHRRQPRILPNRLGYRRAGQCLPQEPRDRKRRRHAHSRGRRLPRRLRVRHQRRLRDVLQAGG
mmetsp:Transcript_48561/g.113700  ORF Transcript_48561/g.113700 Transcript_48561/m.113700 type:complete len:267 (-) Transcript_48561:68-868(-)